MSEKTASISQLASVHYCYLRERAPVFTSLHRVHHLATHSYTFTNSLNILLKLRYTIGLQSASYLANLVSEKEMTTNLTNHEPVQSLVFGVQKWVQFHPPQML